MTKYWVIAPFESKKSRKVFDRCWEYDRQHGTIAIGWHEIGDPSGLTKPELEERIDQTYPGFPGGTQALWHFYNSIEFDDIVIAKRGRNRCIGIGRVTRPAYFDEREGSKRASGYHDNKASFVGVKWEHLGEIWVERMFARQTVSQIDEARYRELLAQYR